MTGIRRSLLEQGYFEHADGIAPELVARALGDVAAHEDALDAFLDDAMWDILDAVVPFAREALDHDVAILPGFWAWRITPGSKGWREHRDSVSSARDQHGKLATVTIWVPLTDATPRNGCMYCVPANWDLVYENPNAGSVIFDQQAVRALPAPAGSVLGWSHALLHWGGGCAPDAPPRISTSYEFVRSDLTEMHPRRYPIGWRPDAAERVALLAEMRTKYAHISGE